MKIYVIGKQWMWKIEHPGGQSEINALHLPIGRPIELVMTSEDVIHDFSVPAFRIKHDVLPGRYETLVVPSRPSPAPIICSARSSAAPDHAQMTGEIVAMTAPEYQKWLAQNGAGETLAAAGKTLFMRNGCSGCHGGNGVGGIKPEARCARRRSPAFTAVP